MRRGGNKLAVRDRSGPDEAWRSRARVSHAVLGLGERGMTDFWKGLVALAVGVLLCGPATAQRDRGDQQRAEFPARVVGHQDVDRDAEQDGPEQRRHDAARRRTQPRVSAKLKACS